MAGNDFAKKPPKTISGETIPMEGNFPKPATRGSPRTMSGETVEMEGNFPKSRTPKQPQPEPTKKDTNFLKDIYNKSIIGRTVQGVDDMANHGATLDQSFRQNFGDTPGGKVVTGIGDFFTNLQGKPAPKTMSGETMPMHGAFPSPGGIQQPKAIVKQPQAPIQQAPAQQAAQSSVAAPVPQVRQAATPAQPRQERIRPEGTEERPLTMASTINPNLPAPSPEKMAEYTAAQAALVAAGKPPTIIPYPTGGIAGKDTGTGIGSTLNASTQMQKYDTGTQEALGQGDPAEAMKLSQAAAAQTAQAQSDAAIRQAVKGAKTSGAMGGQAALMGATTGADAYGQGMAQGTQQYFDTAKLGASLGSEMSQRLARGEALSAQEKMAAAQLKQAASAQKASDTQSWWDRGVGLVGGIAGLFSDKNLKEEIKPKDITRGLEKITGFAYKYKGQPRQEAGIMAQDLEKTAMAPAVIDTPQGKVVETRRLSAMNTAALSEHEKRLKDIERLIKGMGEIQKPKGKE